MPKFLDRFFDQCSQAPDGVWQWFNSLTREEWVVVLGVVCVMGFFCMLGYGSRSKY